jgi:protein-tyrosine kinase
VSDQLTSAERDKKHRIKDMGASEKITEAEMDEMGLIHPGMENQSILNSYREIRNKLLKLSDYRNFVCLVTSLNAKDETSLQALNLAAVFAFDKARSALVVDCTTSDNVIDSILAVDEALGLIDFIESDYDDLSALVYECRLDRIRIIPAGNRSETRTETLESTRMREIIIELKNRYPDRFIFINAPSMVLSSEVQVLSNVSDMVIFEMTPGTVTADQVKDAVEMIGAEKVAGILFQET